MTLAIDWSAAPQPYTPAQKRLAFVAAAVIALSRLLAVARTLWDWDEVLFCQALRDFDVTAHHPHPPGFPVFVAAARLVRLGIDDDFRALQAVSVASSMLLFPVLLLFCRELRIRFPTSIIASSLCCFSPNVWFYGGTAFSDVASLVLVTAACAFLLWGCRSPGAYVVGTILLALAIGVRSQNLLVGLLPLLLATRFRLRGRRRVVAAAALIAVAIVVGSYAGAAIATGSWDMYQSAISHHGDYIKKVDSFLSPTRLPLWHLFDRFFLRQYQWAVGGIVVSLLVLGSLVQCVRTRELRPLVALAVFAPFCLFAWLMLDRYSINRFAIGYSPPFAILAADGLWRLANWVSRRLGRFSSTAIEAVLAIALVGSFACWALPALNIVRTTAAPTVSALEWLRANEAAPRGTLYVGRSMKQFVEYSLPDVPFAVVANEHALPLRDVSGLLLAEWLSGHPQELAFRRERGRLWSVARRHYFDVSISPLRPAPVFLDGWAPADSDSSGEFRRMSTHSLMLLPRSSSPSWLTLEMELPSSSSTVEVRLDGVTLGRATPSGAELEIEYKVAPSDSESHRLELVARDGLVLRRISWGHRVRK
ncbi:MAG: hypothetical protein ACSLFQ_16500 [Thermoanaerobaculia bacterium]